MSELKEKIKKILNRKGVIGNIYRWLSAMKYKITVERKRMPLFYNYRVISKGIKEIEKNKNKKYIVLYNPTWLGVANSTKGLFNSNIPLEALTKKSERKRVIKAINKTNVDTVIFSQIVDGWIELIEEIKKEREDLKIKVIWHANNFEVISDYTWDLNKKVIDLYDKGYITSIAFVKKSMAEFYKKKGYNTFSFLNTVNINPENLKTKIKETEENFLEKQVKIGIYNAHSRELKNVYTQILVGSFFKNGVVDIVPSSNDIERYAKNLGIKHTSIMHFIKTEELMERIRLNDINIYVTFTECSPMFPMESFEVGVPCLIGNNNDYFQGSKLREYVCVNREDDPKEMYNKIVKVLENKEEVMNLYKKWKLNFDLENNKEVERFINS